MSTTTAVILVVLSALGTYLSRAGMILLLAGRDLPEPVLRGLRNVGPAVLAALVVTFVADPDQAYRGLTIPEVAALAVSAGVHVRWKNLLATLIIGMSTFWIVRAIVDSLG